MIRAIAVDDEPKALSIVEHHASKVSFLDLLTTFTNPLEALSYMEQKKVDLIFLDVNMPDISGLEISKMIQKKKTFIIFTTAYSQYALDGFEVSAVDFLLKPFDYPRFHQAVSKVQERLSLTGPIAKEFLFLNSGTEMTKVRLSDILYIKSEGNYMTYVLENEKVMVRSTIQETCDSLPQDNFVRIQRSYIVAIDKIDTIKDNRVHISGHKISIGPQYKTDFYAILRQHP